jgi:hypothetical protein
MTTFPGRDDEWEIWTRRGREPDDENGPPTNTYKFKGDRAAAEAKARDYLADMGAGGEVSLWTMGPGAARAVLKLRMNEAGEAEEVGPDPAKG